MIKERASPIASQPMATRRDRAAKDTETTSGAILRRLEVIHAAYLFFPDLSETTVLTEEPNLVLHAEELLRKTVEPALATRPGVHVTTRAGQGPPARTLIDAAAGADLLVVGSRGRGGFAGLLLGSVSQQVVNHAPCPVVVVPSRHQG
jgi:nucleotide-binding universal stress UspA family protein